MATEVYAKTVGERIAALPSGCNVTTLQVQLLSGVPHCGSYAEMEYVPSGGTVLVNSDAVLCPENTILRGAVKVPMATAVFKLRTVPSLFKMKESICLPSESNATIREVMIQTAETCGYGGNCLDRCDPDYLLSINKHLWVDDARLVEMCKANLAIAQRCGPTAGIHQFQAQSQVIAGDDWPCVMMPGGLSSVFTKDGVHMEVHKYQDFPPNKMEPVRERGPAIALEHPSYADSLALESKDYVRGGFMVFQSELGPGGCVGLYLKKIRKKDRFSFLTKSITSSSAIATTTTKIHTFSTFKYKWYIMVNCTGGQRAREFYEQMICGEALGGTNECPERPTTIGDFACSIYYKLYMKECAENARRLAFRYANCLQLSLYLRDQESICDDIGEDGMIDGIHPPEVHWGQSTASDRALHKMYKRSRRRRIIDADAEGGISVGGSTASYPTETSSSSSGSSSSSENDNDSSYSPATRRARASEEQDVEEDEEYVCKRRNKKARLLWKKRIVQADSSIGTPQMGLEKCMQFSGTLRMCVIPGTNAPSDSLMTRACNPCGEIINPHPDPSIFVQIHGDTVSIATNEAQPKFIPTDGTAVRAALIKLPPLQGYTRVKFGAPAIRAISTMDPIFRVTPTCVAFHPECINTAASSNAIDFEDCLDNSGGMVADSVTLGCYKSQSHPRSICSMAPECGCCGSSTCMGQCGRGLRTVHLNGKHELSGFLLPHKTMVTMTHDHEENEEDDSSDNDDVQDESSASSASDDSVDEHSHTAATATVTTASESLHSLSTNPAKKTKEFENEIVWGEEKERIVVGVHSPSLSATNIPRSNRQTAVGWLMDRDNYPDSYAIERYEKALKNVYLFPSDMSGDYVKIVDFSGNRVTNVNPHHLSHHHMAHLSVDRSMNEVVDRALGVRGTIICRRNATDGNVVYSVSDNNRPLRVRVGAMEETNGGGVDGMVTREYSSSTEEMTERMEDPRCTVNHYLPVCCVEALPIPFHQAHYRNIIQNGYGASYVTS